MMILAKPSNSSSHTKKLQIYVLISYTEEIFKYYIAQVMSLVYKLGICNKLEMS